MLTLIFKINLSAEAFACLGRVVEKKCSDCYHLSITHGDDFQQTTGNCEGN